MKFKKYHLKDGSVYWHRLYFDFMPEWMTKYGPPFGTYNYSAYLYQPHKYLADLFREAKYFIQRGYRGYSDRDVWSIDWFLTTIMPPILRRLKKTTHGYPTPNMGMKRWQKKLEKMAQTFEVARRIQEYDKDSLKLQKEFNRGMQDFVKYFFNLWD